MRDENTGNALLEFDRMAALMNAPAAGVEALQAFFKAGESQRQSVGREFDRMAAERGRDG